MANPYEAPSTPPTKASDGRPRWQWVLGGGCLLVLTLLFGAFMLTWWWLAPDGRTPHQRPVQASSPSSD